MIASRKKSAGIGLLAQVVGAACFLLVLPFGIIFGLLHRLFTAPSRD